MLNLTRIIQMAACLKAVIRTMTHLVMNIHTVILMTTHTLMATLMATHIVMGIPMAFTNISDTQWGHEP
ncbi:hypothetical protein A3763_24315 [Oleiphilus sp. HI0128]|nr:hypothetical protein A3763_24315 [Oleiphilus sp. HI0128]